MNDLPSGTTKNFDSFQVRFGIGSSILREVIAPVHFDRYT